MNFSESVLTACRKIPKGKVSTYKSIAVEINSPNSSRAVGNALNKNKFLVTIPCHRVVCQNGFVGGYAQGLKKKIELLKSEGVLISSSKKIDFNKFLFKFWKNY